MGYFLWAIAMSSVLLAVMIATFHHDLVAYVCGFGVMTVVYPSAESLWGRRLMGAAAVLFNFGWMLIGPFLLFFVGSRVDLYSIQLGVGIALSALVFGARWNGKEILAMSSFVWFFGIVIAHFIVTVIAELLSTSGQPLVP